MPPYTRHDWPDADVPPGVRTWMSEVETGIIGAGIPYGNAIYPIGDSITASDGAVTLNADGTVQQLWLGNKQFFAHSAMQANAAFWVAGFAAGPGLTIAQVKTTHLPVALASKAQIVPVMAGTNDLGSLTAQSYADLDFIFQQIVKAGKLPVVVSIPPRSGNTIDPQRLNTWLARYAANNGLPFADVYSQVVDPTGSDYKSPYGLDGVHPTAAGAKQMGLALQKALAMIPPWVPPLAGSNVDTSVLNPNPLLLTDGNADGTPDQWSLTGTGATSSLGADAAVLGNAMTLTRGSADLTQTHGPDAANAGDRISLSFRALATVAATSTQAGINVTTTDGSIIMCRPFNAWTVDFGWTTFYNEFTIPAGKSGVRLQFLLQGAGAGVMKVAQVTLRNLTALGIA